MLLVRRLLLLLLLRVRGWLRMLVLLLLLLLWLWMRSKCGIARGALLEMRVRVLRGLLVRDIRLGVAVHVAGVVVHLAVLLLLGLLGLLVVLRGLGKGCLLA